VKVKFHWDRADVADDRRTCWIRVAQAAAGGGFGAMFIPRVGQEVVVEFLEGNPDRPLITGVVYNANQKVPYALPDNKSRATIRTSSTPGNAGSNELRFEDKANQEEVFFQAQKDFNKVVLHDETATVHGNTTTTVETGDRKVTVSQGGDTLTVSLGNHTVNVSAGKSAISAGQSITLSVGANSLTIDNSGVTINGMTVSVTGDASISLSAAEIALN
jgi:type VI secretion system secreted protein VgrG